MIQLDRLFLRFFTCDQHKTMMANLNIALIVFVHRLSLHIFTDGLLSLAASPQDIIQPPRALRASSAVCITAVEAQIPCAVHLKGIK